MIRPLPPRLLPLAALVLAVLPLLACGTAGLIAPGGGRWACPSPVPLPFGPAGPAKARVPHPTAVPSGPVTEEVVYFAEWEQEYGATHPGPPFPSPTPYAIVGTTFLLGQRVAVGDLHVLVNAHAGWSTAATATPADGRQLYTVDLTWRNPTGAAVPIDYATQLRLREIHGTDGALQTAAIWGVTAESLGAAGLSGLPDHIPPGTSQVVVPILAPPGTPHTVDLDVVLAPPTTPAPNDGLRQPVPATATLQWTAGSLAGIGPACADPGAITPWDAGNNVGWGDPVAVAPAPPGARQLLQIVHAQVGKPYIWGAKGPAAFDCSGLATWSYAQIGIAIPQGTSGQWPGMTPVNHAGIQPGDLVFFDIAGGGQIDHVGILMGDLDGDGQWDMVHAASPELGVRIDYGIFASSFYAARIRGFRTARR